MLYLILFILISIFFFSFLQNTLQRKFSRRQAEILSLKARKAQLTKNNQSLKDDNVNYQKKFEDTVALYDLTKDICKTLDQTKIFKIFKESLDDHTSVKDCHFIRTDELDEGKYKDFTLIPLEPVHNRPIGYLAARQISPEDKDKFSILAQQFIVGIRRALLYQKVQELTITDSLTQVYNRRYFLERFNEELERSKKNKLNLAFLMLDVDNFKKYNDRYGHLVGDAILKQVAKILRDTVRQIDFIGRYGGEEISIVLTETAGQQAGFVAERIRRAINESRFQVYDEDLSVTVSIGISVFKASSLKVIQLIEMADFALYQAKKSGKNKVCFYDGK
ncbi:MAG: GGDEF domain-containing protein [Candidatus Omnitrophica bacterium]|jgi:diguanylate cyclase (GGDEF)-like protein|nr:GGDEF domain-containing protein [Candidatus Omnitrophota bacterium]